MRVIPNAHFSYADSLMSSLGNGWIRLRSKSAVGLICTPKVGLNKPTIEVQILLWVNKPMESFYIQTKTRVSDNSLSSNFGYKSHHSKVCLEKEIVNTIKDYWDYYNH